MNGQEHASIAATGAADQIYVVQSGEQVGEQRVMSWCAPCLSCQWSARHAKDWAMDWGAEIKHGLRPLVDLVYPPRCPVCGEALATHGGLCVECWSEIEAPGEPACSSCARPVGAMDNGDSRCLHCRAEPPRHSGVIAASVYNDASRQLILRFKHGGKLSLAALLGGMMAGHLPDSPSDTSSDQPPLLVPVPLHRTRIWDRGFNQSALLARELEKRGKGELVVDALVRHKRTPSLGGLGREARRTMLKDAIRIREGRRSRMTGSDILLVDDVLTSGATTGACVDALLESGAASVKIVCFARVIDS